MKPRDRYDSLLEFYADAVGIRTELLKAQMLAESAGNPEARSKAGAVGLMQFMPKTWEEWGHGDPTDPEQSIRAGAAYLAHLLDWYAGDERKALAAYNWGQSHVDHALATSGATWDQHLPIETFNYVKKIVGWDIA